MKLASVGELPQLVVANASLLRGRCSRLGS
jgi:hypothetical protein